MTAKPPLATDGEPDYLAAASAAVRAYCGWHVAPVLSESIQVNGTGTNVLYLPSLKVQNVASVYIRGENVADAIEWAEEGLLRFRGGVFPRIFRGVHVFYTHGFTLEDVPNVAEITRQVAERAHASANVPGNISSQSVNGASVQYLSAGGALLGVPLLNIEKEALAPYRLHPPIVGV